MQYKKIEVYKNEEFGIISHPVDVKRIKFMFEIIRDHFGERKTLKILDVGCGYGLQALALAEKGYFVTGIDVNADRINSAKRLHPNLVFIIGDINNIHLKKEYYDIILLIEVLEHVYFPREVMMKLRQSLKKDGVIILSVPNGIGPSELAKDIKHALYFKSLLKNLLKLVGLYNWIYAYLGKDSHTYPSEATGHKQHRIFSSWLNLFDSVDLIVTSYTYTMGLTSASNTLLRYIALSRLSCNIMNKIQPPKLIISSFCFCLKKAEQRLLTQ